MIGAGIPAGDLLQPPAPPLCLGAGGAAGAGRQVGGGAPGGGPEAGVDDLD